MSTADPEMFKLCLQAAAAALEDAMAQLKGAALVAPSPESREDALAPVGGLTLALQHIRSIG